MRVDVYTKTVLTIIMLCLVWLSLGGPALLPPAQAQVNARTPHVADGADRVVIAGWVDASGKTVRFPESTSFRGLPVLTAAERDTR